MRILIVLRSELGRGRVEEDCSSSTKHFLLIGSLQHLLIFVRISISSQVDRLRGWKYWEHFRQTLHKACNTGMEAPPLEMIIITS